MLRALGPDSDALVLAGGSNVVLADDLTRPDRRPARQHRDHRRRQRRARRGRRGVGRRRRHVAGARTGRAGMPVGDPGVSRGDAGAERRRVRRRGRRHHPPGAAARPSHRRGPRGSRRTTLRFGYRTSILKHSVGRRSCSRWSSRWTPTGCSAPLRYGELATALGAEPDAGRPGAGARGGAGAAGTQGHGARRRPTTTPGASGRSSPTRWCRQTEFERLQGRVDGHVPNYPAPDGVKLAAGWLVERAGFGKGYPGRRRPGPAVHQACAGCDQPRDATTADVIALARTVRDGVRTAFGIDLTPEPILIGCGSLGTLGPREPSLHRRDAAAISRRRALTALAVGVVAPGALAACSDRSASTTAGEATAPPAPSVTFTPATATTDVVPTAPVGVEVARRLVPAGRADQRRRQGRRGRAEPGPHRLHRHRTAGLRRRVHLGRLGGRPRRQGGTGRGHVHHGQPQHSGQRPVPARRRPDRRRRGADHHAVRRRDHATRRRSRRR